MPSSSDGSGCSSAAFAVLQPRGQAAPGKGSDSLKRKHVRGPDRIFQGPLTFFAEAVVRLLQALAVRRARTPATASAALASPPEERDLEAGGGDGERGEAGEREGGGKQKEAAPAACWPIGVALPCIYFVRSPDPWSRS